METSVELKSELEKIDDRINEHCKETKCDFNHPNYKTLNEKSRELKKLINYAEVREIQKYCNMVMYSDVHPYEVIKIISDKTIEVRAMSHELVKAPTDFHPGGFCGHYADNHSQEYSYKSNPKAKIERVRWSERNRRWQQGYQQFRMSSRPVYFHDYNF